MAFINLKPISSPELNTTHLIAKTTGTLVGKFTLEGKIFCGSFVFVLKQTAA